MPSLSNGRVRPALRKLREAESSRRSLTITSSRRIYLCCPCWPTSVTDGKSLDADDLAEMDGLERAGMERGGMAHYAALAAPLASGTSREPDGLDHPSVPYLQFAPSR